MRPLSLKMKGFAAFRDETEVDFSSLELVALVGNTGSGKSTIIDAITFALYGTVARYDDERLIAPAINTLSQEARVQLQFELGGHEYTAVRVARRTATGATTKEARLERSGEILADAAKPMTEAVEVLLGLDFARFTKVVVLPQGKFASFLHDKPKERQNLLRQLLDLGVYKRIGEQARSTAAEAEIRLTTLEAQLEQQGVTDVQLKELKSAAKAAKTMSTELEAQLVAWTEGQQQVELRRAEAEGLGLLAIAASRVVVPAQVGQLGSQLADAAAQQQEAATALEALAVALTDADQAVEAGPDAAEFQRLLQDHAERVTLTGRLETGTKLVTEANETHRAATAAAQVQRDQLEAAELEAAKAKEAQQLAGQALADGPNATAIAQARDRRQELASVETRLTEAAGAVKEAAEQVHASQRAADAAATKLDDASEVLKRVEAAKGAAALVASLQVGDNCPVCQQVVTDVPSHDVDAELKQATAVERAARQDQRTAAQQLDAHRQLLNRAEAEVEATQGRKDAVNAALAQDPTSEELDLLEQQLAQLADTAAKAQAQRDDAESAVTRLRSSPDAKAALDAEADATKRTNQLVAQHEALTEQLGLLVEKLDGQPTSAQLEAGIEQAQTLIAQRTDAKAKHGAGKAAADVAAAAVAQLKTEEEQARQHYGAVRDGLIGIGAPAPAGQSLLEDWTALNDWAQQQCAELLAEHTRASTEADAQQTALAEARNAALRLTADFIERPADDPIGLAQQATEVEASARTRYEAAAEALERLAETRNQVDGLKETIQVQRLLGKMLRADGFEAWIMDEVVATLVERASLRLFELSNQQYSLLAEGMDFKVRDHRNGDEMRDAKTLSGGETFLASLALALALADSLADMAPEGTPPLESLFLDEGFGTLDPETLDVVAGAIEELGASGRMVGIVTHIRELAERMPVRLEVTKGPTTSTVEKVEA